MSILGAIMTPHPPLILPEVGRGQEKGIAATVAAMEQAAAFLHSLRPDTVVVLSPHTAVYADYFHISPDEGAAGNFKKFGAGGVRVEAAYDAAFAAALAALCEKEGVSAGTEGERDPALDHATMIPLIFLEKAAGTLAKVVRIGISGLPPEEHYKFGMLIQKTASLLNRRVAVIASGDLSHKLKEDGPYGLSPDGRAYDEKIMDVMGRAAFGELFSFTEDFCASAAECGHRSFLILAGCLDGLAVQAERLSYEGPFGVGYGVCTFVSGKLDAGRHFLDAHREAVQRQTAESRAREDAYVKLARQSFTAWVQHRRHIGIPSGLPPEMLLRKAGVFVSLHKAGHLRGCIGTTTATRPSIAEEILQNAISACANDPRFAPVKPEELTEIECTVDVLGKAEPVESLDQLDVKRYGVIVQSGPQRGLLLPNLPGVDSVEQQVDIARRKGNIAPGEPVTLQRFEVVRHY